MAHIEAAALTANPKATTAGQAAADDAAAVVCEVMVDGKDTARELRPLLAKRGVGEASKSCDVAVCESLPFGSAGSTSGNFDPHYFHISATPTYDWGHRKIHPALAPSPSSVPVAGAPLAVATTLASMISPLPAEWRQILQCA